MEPRKVANYFTLFTLHMIWLMVRGNISPNVIFFRFCCVWFFPRQSHIHIRHRKHSQNARQLLTPPVLQKSKRFQPFLKTENFKCESYSSLSTRDVFHMACDLSHHPKMALAALQKQDKELVIQINIIPAASDRKNILSLQYTLLNFFYYIAGSPCQLQKVFCIFFSLVVHVSKVSWRKLLAIVKVFKWP